MLKRLSEKLNLFNIVPILYLLWIIEQVYYFQKFNGIRIVFDSHRYLAGARDWNQFNIFYSYSAIISPFARYDFLIGITFLQVLLNLIAFYCFIKIIQSYSSEKIIVLVGGLLFLWPELQYWNYFIHTESIFISISVFILYFFTFNKHKLAILAMLILCFIRPNGFIFLLSYFLIKLFNIISFKKIIIPSIILLVGLFVFLTDFVISNLENYPFLHHLKSGELITGVKDWQINNDDIAYCEDCPNSLKIITLALNNPLFYFKFWVGRIIVLFTQVRPYYDAFHNIMVVLLFAPIYYFTGLYIWKQKFKKMAFILLPIVFEVLVVLISGVDWDNRYIVIILPCVFLLSIQGFNYYLNKSNLDK